MFACFIIFTSFHWGAGQWSSSCFHSEVHLLFTYFSCLIAGVRTSSTVWKKGRGGELLLRTGIPALFPILESIQSLTTKGDVSCKAFVYDFYQVYFNLLSFFFLIWMADGLCQMLFLYQLIYNFSSLVCWCSGLHWSSSVEPPLHSWNKFYLVMMYNSFYILLDLICLYFRFFCAYVHGRYWSVVFVCLFWVLSLRGLGIRAFLVS